MLLDPNWKKKDAARRTEKALHARLQGTSMLTRADYEATCGEAASRAAGGAAGPSTASRPSFATRLAAKLAEFFSGIRRLSRMTRTLSRRRYRRAVKAVRGRRARQAEAALRARKREEARQSTRMLALEPRIVFDAASAVTAEAAVDQAAEDSAAEAIFGGGTHTESETQSTSDPAALERAIAEETHRTELVFIDAGVDDAAALLADIPTSAEIIFLSADKDGVEQISAAVAGRSDIDAIHILSHGAPGEITLGNTSLDATSVEGEHADELAEIKSALSQDADLLIYGCDFGANRTTLDALAAATDADVAASD
ncbi:MAG: DUF4347 domain-containing protein, partial [Planctomycetota bacterium]